MKCETREKIAYSWIGKMVSRVLARTIYRQSRPHWIRQAWADGDMSKLK